MIAGGGSICRVLWHPPYASVANAVPTHSEVFLMFCAFMALLDRRLSIQ